MAQYTYVILDSVTGDGLASLPLTGVSYSFGLNGSGKFDGSISTNHPLARRSLLSTISREVLVLREGQPVWVGPITGLSASGDTLTISAAPVWFYMTKRTLELGRNYVNQDLSQIFDDIMTTVNGKYLGDIRLTKESPYNTTGQTYSISYDAISRKFAHDAISELSQIYPGFDWMVNLRTDPATGRVLREYQIYAPLKGVVVDQVLTARNTIDYQDTDDGTRVFNRVHELGAGQGNTQLIVSRSAYEPDAYYDYGEYLTGWTTGGTPTVNTAKGRPPPSFQTSNGAYLYRSYPHGVGSYLEFDYYHDPGTDGGSGGQLNNGGLFYFGCSATGTGMAWASRITSGGVEGMGLQTVGSFGTNTGTYYPSDRRVSRGTWHRIGIKIVTATTANVYIDAVQSQYYNGSSYNYAFPISLSGTYTGLAGLGPANPYGWHFFDNITVPQATSAYTNPGIPYLEEVQSRTDVTDLKTLQFYAQADLFFGRWPYRAYTASYRPSGSLPWGFATPGDKVNLDIQRGYYQIVGQKRIVTITVTVEAGGAEKVDLTFSENA